MELNSYLVVKLLDEDHDVVTVISSTWVSMNNDTATIPILTGHKWHKAVQLHEKPGERWKTVRIKELVKTSKFKLVCFIIKLIMTWPDLVKENTRKVIFQVPTKLFQWAHPQSVRGEVYVHSNIFQIAQRSFYSN